MKIILKNEWTIALLAIILFMPFLGHVHLFDWDEINFAESAREMIVSHNYFSVQINYQRFYEKPPLFFWLQVVSMKIFGINEFAARFPNAVCGIVTLVLIFRIGKKIFNESFARIWVMVYLGTILTFLYFKTGIIDPVFNLFIILAIYHFYLLTLNETGKLKNAFVVGLFLGLAVLTKGPVAIVIAVLSYTVFVLTSRFKLFVSWKEIAIIIVTITAICFLWFGVDLVKNGPWFLVQFIKYQIALFSQNTADHGEPFFYHWWVLLVGCFPASIFFMRGQFVSTNTPQQKAFKKWMMILFWVTLILFSIVKTKIVHYSSLCWFPLTFLATVCINDLWERKAELNKWLKVLLGILGIAIATAIAAVPFVMMHKDLWIGIVQDEFAKGNLQADIHWQLTDSIGGLVLLAGVLTYLISKNKQQKTILLFCSMTICVFLTSIIIAPKIEAFSQRANIEFFEAQQGKDVYVETTGYKSYAQYFYTKSMPHADTNSLHEDWLIYGNINKPVYLSAKIQDEPRLDTVPGIIKLYRKNGFAFYERLPTKNITDQKSSLRKSMFFFDDSLLNDNHDVMLNYMHKYLNNGCAIIINSDSSLKSDFEGVKIINGISKNKKADSVFVVPPFNYCDSGDSYCFFDKLLPRLSTDSYCCQPGNLFTVGDIDEDGFSEIGIYYSPCVSRYKSLIIYSLKDDQWLEIGSSVFDILTQDPSTISYKTLVKKIKKKEFEICNFNDGKTEWKTITMK